MVVHVQAISLKLMRLGKLILGVSRDFTGSWNEVEIGRAQSPKAFSIYDQSRVKQ